MCAEAYITRLLLASRFSKIFDCIYRRGLANLGSAESFISDDKMLYMLLVGRLSIDRPKPWLHNPEIV